MFRDGLGVTGVDGGSVVGAFQPTNFTVKSHPELGGEIPDLGHN